MKLAQYLALGRSIEQVSGSGRYKVVTEPLAPNFSEGAARRDGPRGKVVEIETLFDRSQAPAAGVEARAEPAVEPAAVAAVALPVTAKPVCQPVTKPAVGGAGKAGWFLSLRRNRRTGSRPPEQRELELGLVEPVRNDLRESENPPARAGVGEEPAGETGKPLGRWWQRVMGRLVWWRR